MALSKYFTDEDVISQLRLQFEYEEMWDIDFRTILNRAIDNGDKFFLEFRDRKFNIDKITGIVKEVS